MTTPTLALCAISAAISAAGAYQWQAYRYEARMAALVAEYAQAQHKAVEYAHAETIRLQERKDKAEVQAARRVRAAAADAAVLRGTLDGLRGDLANGATRYATATEQARADYTATLGAVLSDCAGMAGEIAGKADGHVIDLLRLDEQWPPQ